MQISVQSAKQNLGIEPAPHLHCQMSTTRIMMIVILSLIPALGVMTYFFGLGTLIQFVIAALTAIACQILTAIMRGRKIKRVFKDPSGIVTALLLALTLPPLLPWYLTVMATAFAMLLVRECFGGLGMNIFNPAMSGFIFLVISSPGIFYSTWISPTPGAMYVATPSRAMDVIFYGQDPLVLVKEIKDLNVQNEYALSRLMAQQAQDLANTANNQAATAKPQSEADTAANSQATANTPAEATTDATANSQNTANTPAKATTDAAAANTDATVNDDISAAAATAIAEDSNASSAIEDAAANEPAANDDNTAQAAEDIASTEANVNELLADTEEPAEAAATDNATTQAAAKRQEAIEAVIADGESTEELLAAEAEQMQNSIIANAHSVSTEMLEREHERLQEDAVISIEGRFTADALTGATFLESIKTSRKAEAVESIPHVDFTIPSFVAYAWLAGAYTLGGLILIITGCIRIQVPLAFLGAVAATAALWHYYDPTLSITTLEHLLMGGTMLGAFYIITDPVTTCGTFKGRILLSAFIGVLAVIMRINGSYSDSIAFAVMLGNCLAPLMDVMTKRRPFGVGYRPGGLD